MMTLVGLDIETTGLDRRQHHRLIQIGIAHGVFDVMTHDVKPIGTVVCDPVAMAINKFTPERIDVGWPDDEVDHLLSERLRDRGHAPASLTAVGWNVGSFDLHFLREDLPQTAAFFSHRVIDLTGIFIAHYGERWREEKDRSHREVADLLGVAKWHDAGFDAVAALVAFRLECGRL